MYNLVVPNIESVEVRDNFASFVADPLERGLATTIGNSLRRVLLTYLPGAAVTQVRIEGVLHEFMAIPQAKEDMIEFLLNVKAIRLKPVSGNPGKLVIDVAREGEIRASDIKPSNDFQVINPDLHLLTLVGTKARFYAELDVELGTGYRQATANANLPSGYIPVDAIFTPVRQVNFTVETSAIAKGSPYERLRLDLRTDGTTSPQDALGEAANILVEQLSPFTRLASQLAARGSTSLAISSAEDIEMRSIDDLGLSKRVSERLKRSGVLTIGSILELGEAGLLGLPKIGGKALQEIKDSLAKHGIELPLGEVASEGNEPQEGVSDDE